jgi:hypothetical protein
MTLSSVRAMVKAVEEGYEVMADDVPSFLFEDPLKFDPENVLSGFMRGYFLFRVRIPHALRNKC